VRISKAYESFFSRKAAGHLSVTNAMSGVLNEMFGITARPLHDRPPTHFQPFSPSQRTTFLHKLPETAPHATDLLNGRSRLIVSSTSWTADEDFSLLLDALVAYSSSAATQRDLPNLLVIITGKGPHKDHYLSQLKKLNQHKKLEHVLVVTAWLATDDYAALLASADLGVSLHTSASGVDLPMKVVDMFGAGLPVVGWSQFEAWTELVTEGVNGRGFGDAEGLADLFLELLTGDARMLARLREGALRECGFRWDGEWDPVAGRLFGLVR